MSLAPVRALLLIAVVGLASCSTPQVEPSSRPADGTVPAPPLSDSARALVALLPADAAVPGWTRKADPRLYTADSLWDFINGGAEAYLACGFQEVVTSEYVNPAYPSGVLVDIYRMSDAAGAMGIYGQERSPKNDPRAVGAEGHLAGTSLNFWSNAYYVKLTAFEQRSDIEAAMARLAEAVSARIGPAGPRPSSGERGRCGAAASR